MCVLHSCSILHMHQALSYNILVYFQLCKKHEKRTCIYTCEIQSCGCLWGEDRLMREIVIAHFSVSLSPQITFEKKKHKIKLFEKKYSNWNKRLNLTFAKQERAVLIDSRPSLHLLLVLTSSTVHCWLTHGPYWPLLLYVIATTLAAFYHLSLGNLPKGPPASPPASKELSHRALPWSTRQQKALANLGS